MVDLEVAKKKFLLGLERLQLKDWVKAEKYLWTAHQNAPERESVITNLIFVLLQLNKYDEAEDLVKKVSIDQTEDQHLCLNIGNFFERTNKFENALMFYNRVIELNPKNFKAYSNKGKVLKELSRLEESIESYNLALSIEPNAPEIIWNKSLTLLLSGDFVNGWRLYESRWEENEFTKIKRRQFNQPLWLGAPVPIGKSILLHAEQGFGDTVQFCRFAPVVKALGFKVILEVQRELLRPIKSLDGIDMLVTKEQKKPYFDFHCPLMSLPLALGLTLDDIPSPQKYLSAGNAEIKKWQSKLGKKSKPRIGLVWSGDRLHKNDHNRSFLLKDLLDHLIDGLDYISLQKEVRNEDQNALSSSQVLDLSEDIIDFSDTAAICELMDVVISVDTSVAHLSAALGVETWLLIPYVPDFRWLLNREDSPWYPSMRLFRQTANRDWNEVFSRIKAALTEKRHI